MKAARTGATLALSLLEAFTVENDPGPWPCTSCTYYMRTYIEPHIRDIPELARIFDVKRSNITTISFANDASLDVQPASSWNTFRMFTAR